MIISKQKVLEMQFRIHELQEIICPAEQHDWVLAGKEYTVGDTGGEVWYKYVCKRCKKKKESIYPPVHIANHNEIKG